MLAPQPYYSNRGTPMNVRSMLRCLTGDGVRVDLLTFPGGEDTPMEGLTVHRLPRLPGLGRVGIGLSPGKVVLDALMVPRAFLLALRNRYDLVHAVEESVFIGLLLKRCLGLRLIYDMDSSLAEGMATYGPGRVRALASLFRRAERWALRGSDAVITVCGALSDLAAAEAPATPIHQIEDVPLETDGAEEPAGAAVLVPRLAGRKVVLYTGNFEPYQGIPLLLEAAQVVLRRDPSALFVLVGGAGERLAEVSRKARELGLGEGVLFVEPHPPRQMGWFMERAAVLVSPRSEGINTPLKIYTYLESGRPVVATRRRTHTQVLSDGCAVLAEPEPGDLAEGILRLLVDPESAGRLGEAGRRLVRERYSPREFCRKLLSAYARAGGGAGLAPGPPAAAGRSATGEASRGDAAAPAVFLDRDGVINRLLPGEYVRDWGAFSFLPGVAGAITRLRAAGYRVAVITNQQGVGKGLMSAEELEQIHRRMEQELGREGARLDGIYACPHLADAGCDCRKPLPGLIQKAARELAIDLGRSYFVGDAATDMEAAMRAGCAGIYVGPPMDPVPFGAQPHPDLPSFVGWLLDGHGA
jgi:histidinol-phosphate phosphatase family protein